MKLGVVVRANEGAGGTYQYTQSTLRALRLVQGWEITIYGDPNDKLLPTFGFPIKPLIVTPRRAATEVAAFLAGVRLDDPFAAEDAVFAPTYLPGLLHTSKPFIFTLHDLQEIYYPENFSYAQRVWRNWIYKHLLQRATAVLCESQYVKSDIVKYFAKDVETICVIQAPPVNAGRGPESQADLDIVRRRYDLPERFAFYPAQFWPHKNHLRLVEAFSEVAAVVPDLKLVLTGKKRDAYTKVMQAIERAGLGPRVIHVGYVDSDDLFAIYRLATMLVMPSLFESVSIPIYEAFLSGTPVAASGLLALPEQVGNAGLTFDPLSSVSIAQSMISLATNAQLARELGVRGTQRMLSMTFNEYARRLETAFAALIVKPLM